MECQQPPVGGDGDAVRGDEAEVHGLDVVGEHGAEEGQAAPSPERPVTLDLEHRVHRNLKMPLKHSKSTATLTGTTK